MVSPPPAAGPPVAALVLVVGIAATAGTTGPARPEPAAPTLGAVRCVSNRLPCSTLDFHLGLEPGAELGPEALDRALRRLWDSGLVDDVELTLERPDRADPVDPGRAVLVVRVAERPLLDGVRLEGVDRLTRYRLERWLDERSPRRDRPIDRGALERLRQELERLAAAEGRPYPMELALEARRPGSVEAVFRAGERPPAPKIATISFAGVETLPTPRLRRALHHAPASPAHRISGRGRLDRARLADDRAAIEAVYLAHGYKDVAVEPARVAPTESGDAVELVFSLSEGRAWRLGSLSLTGNRALGDRTLLALFERGDGVFRRPAIETWVEAIRRRYVELGRIETTVQPREIERTGGRVDVVVEIEEGDELRLGRLTVRGNERTAGAVLRRELEVDEGMVLDLPAVERGLARLRQRGLFEPAPQPIELTRRGDGSGRVDLALSGRDADPYRFDLGGGWSATRGFSGHLVFEARNLFGRGIAAGLRAAEGEVRDRFELFFVAPAPFDRRQNLSGELFELARRSTPGPDQVDQRRERGWRLAVTRAVGRRQSLRLGLTQARLDDVRTLAATGGVGSSFDRSTLTADWVVDRRDDPLRPSRGLRAHLALAAGADRGVGGRRIVAPRGELTAFHPLGAGVVLAARLRGGTVHSSGGAGLSPLDAFFLGGPGSVRGFVDGSIFPRDETGAPILDGAGFRVGGDRFLEAGLETRWPLGRGLTGAVFVDAGQVWAAGSRIESVRPRAAAGLELWIQPNWLPLPLRLTWSHDLDPLPGDEFDRFLVALGAAF